MPKPQRIITIFIVLVAFLIRFIRLDVPHEWVFDEVYHALSAEAYALGDPRGYEWWNQSPPDLAYEWLHPPLGKLFMAASIKLFATPYIPESKAAPLDGRTTFAWRFPGVIFATLTVWLLIRFGEKLFGQFWVGAVAGMLYALDGLSFVQSRTGMNDIYITFFVVLAFYRLYIFLTEYPNKITQNLAWLGVVAGLAASTKWTGFYAVAICFVWGVAYILKKRKLVIAFKAALLLGILPVLVYVLSYGQWWIQGHKLSQFVELHQQIWWYQTNLKATHDYQSKAYTWPFLLRPVWFYVKYEDVVQNRTTVPFIGNIYTMGHPLIWWAGIIGVLYVVWLLVESTLARRMLPHTLEKVPKQLAKAWKMVHGRPFLSLSIVMVGYFGMFLPWMLSPRIMFLYHYLPSVPFLCLALAYLLFQIREKGQVGRILVHGYLLMVVIGFIYFYPHWSGLTVPTWWANQYYWLPSWK